MVRGHGGRIEHELLHGGEGLHLLLLLQVLLETFEVMIHVESLKINLELLG
jgi:hypothetical protein